jgi:NAD-dependent deacetylase
LSDGLEIPDCTACGGILKTATISFGQAMPEKEMREAARLSEEADLMLVIGSTLVVHPAAQMPVITKQAGGRVVIINLSETGGDHYADLIIRGQAGEVMTKIIANVTSAETPAS